MPINTEILLRYLQSKNELQRKYAAEQLGQLNSSNPQIVQALLAVKESDLNPEIRQIAATSLLAPSHQSIIQQSAISPKVQAPTDKLGISPTVGPSQDELPRSIRSISNLFTLGAALSVPIVLFQVWWMIVYGVTTIRVTDTLISAVFGAISLICSRLLRQRKQAVVGIYAVSILASVGYGLVIGRSLNFLYLAVSGIYLSCLISLWQKRELR